MYIYIYICIYVHICICKNEYVYINIYIYMYTYIQICIYIYIHTYCVHLYTCISINVHDCTCINLSVHWCCCPVQNKHDVKSFLPIFQWGMSQGHSLHQDIIVAILSHPHRDIVYPRINIPLLDFPFGLL